MKRIGSPAITIALLGLALLVAAPAWSQEEEGDLEQHISELREAITRVENDCDYKDSLAYTTNMPIAKLQLKKAELAARQQWGYYANAIGDFKQIGLEALQRVEDRKPHYAEEGTLTELAYVTENDGTVQPYYLHLPESYDAQETYPLIVFLHGYVPTTSVLDPWVLSEDVCEIAENNGCMLLIPYGRRNTDFQGVGEVDILATTELVKQLYSVDRSRIYISGVSMGGMGAWNMALRHPGMYAAGTPIAGQTDMHKWWPNVLLEWPAKRDDLTPYKRLLVEWDNPIDLVMNARNQHIFVQHGENDHLIPVEQSKRMVDAAAKRNIPIKFQEHKGEGHYIYWDLPCFKQGWSWQRQFQLDPNPRRVTYKTYSLEYDTAFWLRIADFVNWGRPATVDCEILGGGRNVEIECENVRLLRIDPSAIALRDPKQCEAMVNDREAEVTVAENGALVIQCADTEVKDRDWPPRKRKGLCGPVEEVFDDPFMIVIGTAGDDSQDQEVAARALQWINDWNNFADGIPRYTVDAEAGEEDIARYNLVLFGTPQTNSVLQRMADKLPIQIGDRQYIVGGDTYAGDNIGLVMCYPNPLAPEHYVAIYSGELYGRKCGINHKHDLIPDFIVFDGDQFSYDETNKHLVAGYFNMNWELDEDLTWRGEQQTPQEGNE